jgi:hypothetical protein
MNPTTTTQKKESRLKPLVTLLTATLVTTLTACGGGNTQTTPPATDAQFVPETLVDPATPLSCGPDTPALTEAQSFDEIFLTQTGSGYYSFSYNAVASSVGPAADTVGISLTHAYVGSATTGFLSQASRPLTGTGSLTYAKVAYLSDAGVVEAEASPYDEIGPCTRIFRKFANGFEFGTKNMSAPLFRVTLNSQDVSGQPVSEVARAFQSDSDPIAYRMPRLVFPSGDTSVMPKGSTMYVPTYEALTTFLRIDLSRKYEGGETLDEMEQWIDSIQRIESLGGYRYAKFANFARISEAAQYVVEYRGDLYYAELFATGSKPPRLSDGVSVVSPRMAFNNIAADFLVRQLGPTPQQASSQNAPIM